MNTRNYTTSEYDSPEIQAILAELPRDKREKLAMAHGRDIESIRNSTNTRVEDAMNIFYDHRAPIERASNEERTKIYAFDTSITANGLSNISGAITEINDSFLQFFGYSHREEVISKKLPDFFSNSDEATSAIIALKEQKKWSGEFLAKRKDGSTFMAQWATAIVYGKNKRIIGYQSTIIDITERKKVEVELQNHNNILNNIIENFPGAISVFDNNLHLVAYNKQFQQLLGFPDSLFQTPNPHFEDFIRFNAKNGEYGSDDIENQVTKRVERARNHQSHKFERKCSNGKILEIHGEPLPDGGFITIYIDITEKKLALKKIEEMAMYDNLTQLPNRNLLFDRMNQAIEVSTRSWDPFAVFFIDLDRFKPVNDKFWHYVGDLLLKEIAGRLNTISRSGDTVARIWGDEFIIIASWLTSGPDATLIAEKIIDALSEIFNINGHKVDIGASIGISLFPLDAKNTDELMSHSDIAMYSVKNSGKNGYQFYWDMPFKLSEDGHN